MYFFTLDYILQDGVVASIVPVALIKYVDGSTAYCDESNPVDETQRLNWSGNVITVKNYLVTEIDRINFGVDFQSATPTGQLSATIKEGSATIAYGDGTVYKSINLLTEYGTATPGFDFESNWAFECVRFDIDTIAKSILLDSGMM